MALLDTIRFVVGIAGNVISMGLFLSPMPTFIQIIKWRDTREYSGVPYVMTILNCSMWMLYGMPFVKPNSVLVLTINGAGLVLESFYTTVFLFCCRKTGEKKKMLGILALIVVFFAALAALTLCLVSSYPKRADIVGTVCIVFNILMYAAPLGVMKKVITEKSVKYMPFTLSLASTLNGVVWTAYGFIPFDRNMVIPNGLGTLLSVVQLILYAIYYKSTNWDEEETADAPKTTEGIEFKTRRGGGNDV